MTKVGMVESFLSMGSLVSYSDGALKIMNADPPTHANVKSQRNILSRTMAINFQSSTTYVSERT